MREAEAWGGVAATSSEGEKHWEEGRHRRHDLIAGGQKTRRRGIRGGRTRSATFRDRCERRERGSLGKRKKPALEETDMKKKRESFYAQSGVGVTL